ncbi:MAG: LEA type 2 family protein [Deltaproteobacteria bacterium]|nr:LEA type 2 family protein [Deltaproteobacteria bacterium]
MNRVIALSSLLLLAGCPKLGDILSTGDLGSYTPSIRFQKLEVDNITFNDADLQFVFQLTNPNPVQVKLSSFSYDLDLAGTDFVGGSSADGMELAASGDTELRLPVSLTFADAIRTAKAVKGQDVIPFTLSGDFGFNTPLGEVKVPYSQSDDLPVLRPPKVRVAALRVAKLDLLTQQAQLELDVGLAHDQGTSMAFRAFDYHLALMEREVAAGMVEDLGEAPVGEEHIVTLPIDVGLVELGTSLVQALTRKDAIQVGLGANMDVDTPLGVLPLQVDKSKRLQLQ